MSGVRNGLILNEPRKWLPKLTFTAIDADDHFAAQGVARELCIE